MDKNKVSILSKCSSYLCANMGSIGALHICSGYITNMCTVPIVT